MTIESRILRFVQATLLAANATIERAGERRAAGLATKAGVKLLRRPLRGATLQAVKALFREAGVVFARKALEKAIPVGVGVVVGGAGNYWLTNFVGEQIIGWFCIDAETLG